ncbi:PREDICTED: uncharacterized protein LOC104733499 [Camelina sativa]|uniref:Uncharacterized protein LOC104733499 n=1 Tax=Camelina sativa TaxID=90675 RepID=A0ABM0V629_CAMSA|nr:PREDICTED: uncharacterized protein LOC104733499 [Camelina sativa]
MTGSSQTAVTPNTDKPFGIAQIRGYIPIQLDLNKLNYDVWWELFETHCSSFGVLGHFDGSSLFDTILKAKSKACDIWLTLEDLFRDNKEARSLQYDNDLRTLEIGDMNITDYSHKLKSLSDLLANLDSPVSDRALVMHMLNGLSDKFDNIINVIQHETPFPSFSKARSMLLMEEKCLDKQVKPVAQHTTNPSSPTVLFTNQHQEQQHTSQQHNNNNNNNSGRRYNPNHCNRGRGRNNRGRGRNNWNNNQLGFPPPWSYTQSPWPYPPQYGAPPSFPPPPYPPTYSPPYGAPRGSTGPYPHSRPHSEAHYVQTPYPMQPMGTTPQLTTLPQAFSTMTLQDPTGTSWVMDTGATNHIANQPGTLRSLFNKSIVPSVMVGNGSSAPVTHTGSSSIPTSSRPLHLRHVLDLRTRMKLLRCNSDGPLYTITPPISPAQAFSALAQPGSLWHRRLGHLGSSALQSLVSSGVISFTKTDMTKLCHACQL